MVFRFETLSDSKSPFRRHFGAPFTSALGLLLLEPARTGKIPQSPPPNTQTDIEIVGCSLRANDFISEGTSYSPLKETRNKSDRAQVTGNFRRSYVNYVFNTPQKLRGLSDSVRAQCAYEVEQFSICDSVLCRGPVF